MNPPKVIEVMSKHETPRGWVWVVGPHVVVQDGDLVQERGSSQIYKITSIEAFSCCFGSRRKNYGLLVAHVSG